MNNQRGSSDISVPQQRYTPGIRVHDIRRGTDFYTQDEALRDLNDEEENIDNHYLDHSSTENNTLSRGYLDIVNGATDPHRSRLQLSEMYLSLFDNIPTRWRVEELCRENVCSKEHLISYLENYGSLAVLIFLRTQREVSFSDFEQK